MKPNEATGSSFTDLSRFKSGLKIKLLCLEGRMQQNGEEL